MTRYDRWSRDGMPGPEDMARIQRSISSTMRDVINDARNGISQSASLIPPNQQRDEVPRAPSGGTTEIKPPPGVNYVDALCDAADRRDRLAAIRQAAENAEIERHLDRKDHPYQAQGVEYNPFDSRRIRGDDDE
jgi:hypothetical protein